MGRVAGSGMICNTCTQGPLQNTLVEPFDSKVMGYVVGWNDLPSILGSFRSLGLCPTDPLLQVVYIILLFNLGQFFSSNFPEPTFDLTIPLSPALTHYQR